MDTSDFSSMRLSLSAGAAHAQGTPASARHVVRDEPDEVLEMRSGVRSRCRGADRGISDVVLGEESFVGEAEYDNALVVTRHATIMTRRCGSSPPPIGAEQQEIGRERWAVEAGNADGRAFVACEERALFDPRVAAGCATGGGVDSADATGRRSLRGGRSPVADRRDLDRARSRHVL
jgi:hypothetical protein